MLNAKFKKLSKIGPPNSIYFVAVWLGRGTTKIDVLKEMASNTPGIAISEIEPILLLFESMGIVGIKGVYIETDHALKQISNQGESVFRDWFLDRFIDFALKEEIIEIDSITYSIDHDAFIMSATTIKPEHACFRNVLTDYQVITFLPDARYLVNEPLDKVFNTPTRHHAISETQLLNNLKKQREQGERGELFVLEYEKKRITNKALHNGIKRISIIDVASGYDIVSYNNNESIQKDRFIEVKTYKGSEHFHWSKNEIEKAELMGDKYFLYLVDDDCIDKEDYAPTIIQNPVHNVLKSEEWLKKTDSLSIEKVITGNYEPSTYILPSQDKKTEQLRKELREKDDEIRRLKYEISDLRNQNHELQSQSKVNVVVKNGDFIAGDKQFVQHMDNMPTTDNAATDTPDIHTDTPGATPPPFEEAIPECFRTGILMTAWDKLRKEGILRDDFQMTERNASVANRIVSCFNEKLKTINPKAKVSWVAFEKFWGFNNLQQQKSNISQQIDLAISNIFRNL